MARQNILIADSELLTRDLLKKMLGRAGFNVHAVSEFIEAEKAISSKKFPLAMISSKPGDKEVRKLVGRLHELRAGCIIFLLTVPPGGYEAETLISMGIHDVIIKPFRLEEVKLKIRHANEMLSLRQKLRKAEARVRELQERSIKIENPVATVEIPELEELEKVELTGVDVPEVDAEDKSDNEHKLTSSSEVEKAYKRQTAGLPKASGQDAIEQIKRLDELKKSGILTAEEFNSKKKELLGRI